VTTGGIYWKNLLAKPKFRKSGMTNAKMVKNDMYVCEGAGGLFVSKFIDKEMNVVVAEMLQALTIHLPQRRL